MDYIDASSDGYQSAKKQEQIEDDPADYELGHSFQSPQDTRIAQGGMVVAGDEYNEHRTEEQQNDSLFNHNQVIFEYYQDHQMQMYNYQQQYLQPGNMNLNDMIQQNDMTQEEPEMIQQPAQMPLILPANPRSASQAAGKVHSKSHKDRLDTSNRKYVCTMCNKRFTRPSTLTTHMNSHTGERPYPCEAVGCNWRFTVLSNLKRHTKICPHLQVARAQSHHQLFHSSVTDASQMPLFTTTM
jgi:hypothetical protein